MTNRSTGNIGIRSIAFVALWSALCWAQQPAPPSGANPSAAASPAAKAPQPPAGRQNRRDPFNDPVPPKKGGPEVPLRLPPGKKGLIIEQLQLQGIARAVNGQWIAVVDNKTKRAYFLRERDELYNGVVSKITPDSIVFTETQTENGKSSSREVVKKLTAG